MDRERYQQEEKSSSASDNIFNPIFSSLHNVSEDSGHRNYLDAPMDPPSPYRLKVDASSDEALKHIRTANSITISPGMLRSSLGSTS